MGPLNGHESPRLSLKIGLQRLVISQDKSHYMVSAHREFTDDLAIEFCKAQRKLVPVVSLGSG